MSKKKKKITIKTKKMEPIDKSFDEIMEVLARTKERVKKRKKDRNNEDNK